MHSVTGKVKNAAAVAEEKAEIFKAKAAEKAEKAVARSREEKMVSEELRKAREYEAKMKLHETKAEIIQDKMRLHGHHQHGHRDDPLIGNQGHHGPVGTGSAVNPTTGVPTSTYPQGLGGGHPPGYNTHL